MDIESITAGFGAAASLLEIFEKWRGKSKAGDFTVSHQDLLAISDMATKALEGLRQSQEENKQLNEQIEKFDKWEEEKAKYKPFLLETKSVVYRLREEFSEEGIVYDICPNCFEKQRKSILQPVTEIRVHCPNCEAGYDTEKPHEEVYTVPTYKG